MSGLLGPEARKIQPKLRMIADGSSEVNLVRAEHCSPLAIDTDKKDVESIPVLRGEQPVASCRRAMCPCPRGWGPTGRRRPRQRLHRDPGRGRERRVRPCRIRSDITPAGRISWRRRSSSANCLPFAKHGRVMHIELGEPIAAPTPEVSRKSVKEPESDRWRFGDEAKHKDGEDVLIGIIDVQGFDFHHPDFRDGDRTRFVSHLGRAGPPSPARTSRTATASTRLSTSGRSSGRTT